MKIVFIIYFHHSQIPSGWMLIEKFFEKEMKKQISWSTKLSAFVIRKRDIHANEKLPFIQSYKWDNLILTCQNNSKCFLVSMMIVGISTFNRVNAKIGFNHYVSINLLLDCNQTSILNFEPINDCNDYNRKK